MGIWGLREDIPVLELDGSLDGRLAKVLAAPCPTHSKSWIALRVAAVVPLAFATALWTASQAARMILPCYGFTTGFPKLF